MKDKPITWIEVVAVLAVLGELALLGSTVYVLQHFIRKYW